MMQTNIQILTGEWFLFLKKSHIIKTIVVYFFSQNRFLFKFTSSHFFIDEVSQY